MHSPQALHINSEVCSYIYHDKVNQTLGFPSIITCDHPGLSEERGSELEAWHHLQ